MDGAFYQTLTACSTQENKEQCRWLHPVENLIRLTLLTDSGKSSTTHCCASQLTLSSCNVAPFNYKKGLEPTGSTGRRNSNWYFFEYDGCFFQSPSKVFLLFHKVFPVRVFLDAFMKFIQQPLETFHPAC